MSQTKQLSFEEYAAQEHITNACRILKARGVDDDYIQKALRNGYDTRVEMITALNNYCDLVVKGMDQNARLLAPAMNQSYTTPIPERLIQDMCLNSGQSVIAVLHDKFQQYNENLKKLI